MLYVTLMCTLHVYKPTVQPVSCSLFLEIEELTLLTLLLFAHANFYYQATLIFFNNVCSTLTNVYTYDGT